jgi:hypothetical protein
VERSFAVLMAVLGSMIESIVDLINVVCRERVEMDYFDGK